MKNHARYLIKLWLTAVFLGLCALCTDGPVAGGSDTEDYEGYGFAGTVRYADGTPAAGAAVEVHPSGSYGSGGNPAVLTGADGSYTVKGLQPDTYFITVTDTGSKGAVTEAALTATGLTSLGAMDLIPTGCLAGTITLSDPDPDLFPLWVRIRGIWKSAYTRFTGAYRIDNLPAGTYTVRIESPWPANTVYGIAETTVTVVSGDTARLDLDGLPLRNISAQDSLIVRTILDTNGIAAGIEEYCHVLDGRVVSFHDFNGTVSVLPPAIGSLDRLEVLVLMDGNIGSWPAELADLPELKKVSLIRQGLTGLPGPVVGLSSLVQLNISGNPLDTLPAGIFGMTNLHFLHADSCGLTILQPEVAELPLLSHLFLRNNALSALPPELTGMDNLVEIRIAGNAICSLPDSVTSWLGSITADWDSAGQCR